MKGTAKNRWVHGFVIGTFVTLYFMVSIISTIHVIDFFKLSNPTWLAISLAIAFEIGAAASLAAIIILEKTSRFMVWSLFLILTAMQAMGNTYYAFINLSEFQGWIELFGLQDAEPIAQKRILSIVSGAILPIVALGFIKSLVDYIRPEEPTKMQYVSDDDNLGFLGEDTKKKEDSLSKPMYSQSNEALIERHGTKLSSERMKIEKQDLIVDDMENLNEGQKMARGLDTFIQILEEEEEDVLENEQLLQKIPTPHLPKNENPIEEEKLLKLGGKIGQPGMFHEITGSKATAKDIQQWMEQQKKVGLSGISKDVGMEERITQKNSDEFNGNI